MQLSLQFHATRAEIAGMTGAWAQEHDLNLFWESGQGSTYAVTAGDAKADPASLPVEVYRIGLTVGPPDLAAADTIELMESNPSTLTVTLGGESDAMLRESMLSAGSDDPVIAAMWRRIRNSARRQMQTGAWVVGATGVRSREAKHYYTAGAKALADRGVRIMSIAGSVEYLLD
jgi:hypothetical protein